MCDDYGIPNRERFFTEQYHILTHSIKAERFFTWLRSRGVFSQTDQEDVETRYPTTYLRAGHLIDIIRTKGNKGFVSFMQVLEWEFPEAFMAIMKKTATKPPSDFRPKMSIRRSNISDELMPRLLALLKELDTKMTNEQAIFAQQDTWMQQFQKNLREEDAKIEEELGSYERQVEALNYKLEQKILECAEKDVRLSEKCRSEADLKNTVERLRMEKESLMNRICDLSVNIVSQKKMYDSAQVEFKHGKNSEVEQLTSENVQLKNKLDRSMAQLAADDSWLEEMGNLRTRLRGMVDKNNQLDAENNQLRSNVIESETKCQNLQEKLVHLQQELDDLKSENIKLESQLLSREKELTEKKEKIKEYDFHMQHQQAEIDFLMTPMRDRVNAIDRSELLKRLAKEPVKVTLSKIQDLEQKFDAASRITITDTHSNDLDEAVCLHCEVEYNKLQRKHVIKRKSSKEELDEASRCNSLRDSGHDTNT